MWGTSSPGDKLTDFSNELTPHLSAIVACSDFWREICYPAFSDFCNTIDPSRTLVGGKARRCSAILRPVRRSASSTSISEQFRPAPRTCLQVCGRLSLRPNRQIGRSSWRMDYADF